MSDSGRLFLESTNSLTSHQLIWAISAACATPTATETLSWSWWHWPVSQWWGYLADCSFYIVPELNYDCECEKKCRTLFHLNCFDLKIYVQNFCLWKRMFYNLCNTYCLEIWYGGFLSASTDWPGQLLLFQWWRVVLHVSLSQSLRVKLRRILVAETKKSLSLIWVKTALPNVRYNCRICTVLEGWKPYGNIT